MTGARFHAANLGFAYGLHEASFELPQSGLVAVIGPNGAGKSTLLGILAGLRSPYTGHATFEGREVRDWPRRQFARQVAFVAQTLRVEFPFTVEEIVLMGRAPFSQGWFETPADHAESLRAMELTDTVAFRDRDVRSLSGGERQRVIVAAALAQNPRVLLLDEPATFLDLHHQLALHQLLASLATTMLVVAVTHDLNLALQFADHVLVFEKGALIAEGEPGAVLTEELISRVFEVRASVHRDASRNRNWMRYEI